MFLILPAEIERMILEEYVGWTNGWIYEQINAHIFRMFVNVRPWRAVNKRWSRLEVNVS